MRWRCPVISLPPGSRSGSAAGRWPGDLTMPMLGPGRAQHRWPGPESAGPGGHEMTGRAAPGRVAPSGGPGRPGRPANEHPARSPASRYRPMTGTPAPATTRTWTLTLPG